MAEQNRNMVLHAVAPGKMYFEICFADIPVEFILGGTCFVCCRRGPVDRLLIEQRHGAGAQLRHVDDRLRCLGCGNTTANTFCVVGRSIRASSALPAGVVDGIEPLSKRIGSIANGPSGSAPPR